MEEEQLAEPKVVYKEEGRGVVVCAVVFVYTVVVFLFMILKRK